MNLLTILLQEESSAGGGFSGMIMIIAMIVIFYFFMIRPQSKKQKEIKRAREAMQKGDSVVTAGGIHGKIKELNENTIIMEVAPGVSLKVDKASVFPAGQPEDVKKQSLKKDIDREEISSNKKSSKKELELEETMPSKK